jgi:hypothetical protein
MNKICKQHHYNCYHIWATGAWNPGVLFGGPCIILLPTYAFIFQELSSHQESTSNAFLRCSHACYGSHQSLLYNNSNVVSWGLPSMKPLVMELSPASCYIFFRRTRCSLARFSQTSSVCALHLLRETQVSHPSKSHVILYFNLYVFRQKKRQNVLYWMVAGSLLMEFYFVTVVLNHGFIGRVYTMALDSMGARGSVVGWGTMLQAGRSRVRTPMRSLNFSIDLSVKSDLTLPAALWPWGRVNL